MSMIPIKKLNDGATNYFPVAVPDCVFFNKNIEVKNQIGGLQKGSTIQKNTNLSSLINTMISTEGPDPIVVDSQLSDTSTNPVQNKVVKAAIDDASGKVESVNYTSPDKDSKNITLNYLIGDSDDKVYAKTIKNPTGWIQIVEVRESEMWNGLAYGDGKFVAAASSGIQSGCLKYSIDGGVNWTRTDSTNAWWNSVTYGNGKFVACGTSNGLWHSDNGINWTQSKKTNGSFSVATYGNGKFFASEYSSGLWYSDNGIDWIQSDKTDGKYLSFTSGNGKFVAGSQGSGLWYSDNGINWTQSKKTNGSWYSLTYGNGKFISGTYDNGLWYSVDGINWIQSKKTNGSWYSLIYEDGKFVAGSEGSGLWYSDNGIDWIQSDKTNGRFRSLAYGNGKFIAAGSAMGLWRCEPIEKKELFHSQNLTPQFIVEKIQEMNDEQKSAVKTALGL